MGKVTCTWTHRDEVFEGYVRDALSPDERDAFEEHYFACAACLDKVRTYRAMRAELEALPAEAPAVPPVRSPAWPWRWALVPVAVGAVVVIAMTLWLRAPGPRAPESTAAVATAPRAAPVVPPTSPTGAQPTAPPSTPPAMVEAQPLPGPDSAPVVALTVLARVEPPLYIPLTLRGPREDAVERFMAAMQHYLEGDYAGAIPGLTAAADLNPKAAPAIFFLAICNLLTDRLDAAIDGLQETVALGDPSYLEEAHYYLAKAWLRQGNIPAAQADLRRTIEQRGRLEADARRLLAQLDALAQRK